MKCLYPSARVCVQRWSKMFTNLRALIGMHILCGSVVLTSTIMRVCLWCSVVALSLICSRNVQIIRPWWSYLPWLYSHARYLSQAIHIFVVVFHLYMWRHSGTINPLCSVFCSSYGTAPHTFTLSCCHCFQNIFIKHTLLCTLSMWQQNCSWKENPGLWWQKMMGK